MSPELLGRYANLALPRYTSYPTAPHFGSDIGEREYRAWLGGLDPASPVSLYLHVPFCRSMCWYCACNTTVTARDEPIDRYLELLAGEIRQVSALLPARMSAHHVHFGGGTPTLIQPSRFLALIDVLRVRFNVEMRGEVAIEIDPRTLTSEMVVALARGGVTRASLGIQSFDPVVQRAINRVQSFEQTAGAVRALRSAGIAAINFDLVYGLPHQDARSCRGTVAQAVALEPDRLAVFGYAHVPSFKRHQRRIDEAALAGARGRHEQAEAIAEALVDAGYVRIGLDHFARPGDPMVAAQASGTLRRNFQGYTTDNCDVLLGFGASAIGRLPQGHVQNRVPIGDYERRIAATGLATAKGYAFTAEDRLRGALIERIMCDMEVDPVAVCRRFGVNPESLVPSPRLDELIGDGLVRKCGNRLVLEPSAGALVRVFAAAFDDHLERAPTRHSRAV